MRIQIRIKLLLIKIIQNSLTKKWGFLISFPSDKPLVSFLLVLGNDLKKKSVRATLMIFITIKFFTYTKLSLKNFENYVL